MTKIPSVEERVESLQVTSKLETNEQYLERVQKIMQQDRLTLLTELRDSGLLKNKPMNVFSFVLQGEELEHYMRYKGHNHAVEAIKAHLDELIKSNNYD